MSPSKYSLSKFVSQFNVALKSKAVCFAVEFNKVNFRILEIFKKEGLITGFNFNQELPAKKSSIEYLSDHEKKGWGDPRDYSNMCNAVVNSGFLDKTKTPGDRFLVNKFKWHKNMLLKKHIFKDVNVDFFRLQESDAFFMRKLAQLFKSIAATSLDKRLVWVRDCGLYFAFEELETRYQTHTNINNLSTSDFYWEDLCGSFLKLRKQQSSCISPLQGLELPPILIPFDFENEGDILKFIEDALICMEYGVFDNVLSTATADQSLRFNASGDFDTWSIKTGSSLTCKDKLYVYPKYETGISLVKRLKLYGVHDTYQYVSRRELQAIQQMHGFQSLFIISTPDGVISSTKAFLEPFGLKEKKKKLLEGGLLLVRVDL